MSVLRKTEDRSVADFLAKAGAVQAAGRPVEGSDGA